MDPTCYCFPEIPEPQPGCRGRNGRPSADFRRAVPGDAARPGRAGRPAAGAAGREGREDLAHEAYCRGFGDGERSGFEKGRQAAEEEGRLRFETGLAALRQAASGLEELRRSLALGLEEEIVQLALAVARKVVGRELGTDPEALAGIVRKALERVENAGRIGIRMNPADIGRLAEFQARVLDGFTDSGLTVFVADEAVSPGGCLIETEAGEVDARLEQQFRVVEEAFRAELAAEAGRG